MSGSDLDIGEHVSIATIVWRRIDRPGHESARLRDTAGGHMLDGAAVCLEAGAACKLVYSIECDRAWRTVSMHLDGWVAEREIALAMTADERRRWTVNGAAVPELRGCEDVDLGFSPSTNLLPVRRLTLALGQQAAVRAAWVRFPECVVEPLDQVYERIAERTYRYQSAGGRFTALLEVDENGFVVRYPGFWEKVAG